MSDVKTDGAKPWTDRIPTVEQVQRRAAAGGIPVAWVAVALVAFFPLGLYFVWKHPGWTAKTKGIGTGAWAVALLAGLWFAAPLVIFLTLLGTFVVAFGLIWSSPSLAPEKKKRATGVAVAGLLLCVVGEFVFFSVRAYNREKDAQQKHYAERAARDKEAARQKDEAVRQKLDDGNRAWEVGEKGLAVSRYRECIELGLSRGSEASAAYQRVIEHDVRSGNVSSAKALLRQARRWGAVELAFTDAACNELLKDVEAQIAEEKRVDDERRKADEQRRAAEAPRKNSSTTSPSSPSISKSSTAYKAGYQAGYDHGVEMVGVHSLRGSSEDDRGIEENLRLYQSGGAAGSSAPDWVAGFKEGCRKGLGKYYRK